MTRYHGKKSWQKLCIDLEEYINKELAKGELILVHQILSWCKINYTCTSHITEWKHTCLQVSLLWWTVRLITGIWTIRLHAELAGGASSRRTHFAYRAEAAWRGPRGATGRANGPLEWTWESLRERVGQRRGAAGVPARGWPDRTLASSGEERWRTGSRDVVLWLADSVAGALFQMLQSVLEQKRSFSCFTSPLGFHQPQTFS